MATALQVLHKEATQLLAACSTATDVVENHGERLRKALALRYQCEQGTVSSTHLRSQNFGRRLLKQWISRHPSSAPFTLLGPATVAADPGCFDVEAQQVFEQWLTLGSMPLAVAQRTFVATMVEVTPTRQRPSVF